ncbi:MAG: hypothetical protein KKA73_14205 [Chloroflexi bacterium]|nr:hypothetical protein [Chloroflexota bacterium]MBU1748838.1 hypothetical protein [Chloroflexota bacterium]
MNSNQKQWLAWGVVAVVLAALAIGLGVAYPVPPAPSIPVLSGELGAQSAYFTPVYVEHGGKKLVVGSGGEIEVQSGGTIDIQSGATTDFSGGVDLDGAALTLDAAGGDTLQSAAATTVTLSLSAATDKLNVVTGNIKVGNGINGTTLNGEDVYIEGTLEVDGVAYLDGGGDLNGTSLVLDAAGADTLQSAAATTTTLNLSAAGDIFYIPTGSVKMGAGIPGSTLNGGDLYVQGTFESDSTANIAGLLTAGAGVTLSDGDLAVADYLNITAQSGIVVTNGAAFTITGTTQPISAAGEVTPTLTMGSANQYVVLINTGANEINIEDTGNQVLSAVWEGGQYDVLVLWCDGTRWIEISRSNN